MSAPEPPLEHLFRLTDGTGLFEHALGASPRREYGYCTDDVARALVVVLRESRPYHQLHTLETIYVAFLAGAARDDGRFHNRRAAEPDGRWTDGAGSDDTLGRALWALGSAAAHASAPGLRRRSRRLFEHGAGLDTHSPRANAAAVLGAVELLAAEPGHVEARRLLERSAARLGDMSPGGAWPWPERRLAYENARLPEARIAAGAALGDGRLVEEGLGLLAWLVDTETLDGHFSFAPVGGWTIGELRPGFDQQPVEAGAMADACARAYRVTGEERWADACLRAAAWFLGANDVGLPLLDAATGGCRDGLEPGGVNLNEGAESTLALIGALQQARAVQAARRSAASSGAVSTIAAPT